MLKIKDDIDLKELEKYGFEYYIKDCGTCGYSLKTSYGFYNIVEKDKENFIRIWERRVPSGIDLDLLYDLIKDGLVEKEEE